MKSRFKKALSIVLCACMVSSVPLSVSATDSTSATNSSNSQSSMMNDVSVTGSNSFGKMFSEEYNENYSQEDTTGYGVYSVEFAENVATVTFDTLQTATVVVGIFDETDKSKMITSEEIQVYKEDTSANLTFDSSLMPEYFYVKAYLVDSETFRPLSKEYTSPKYTADMQYLEQLSTTDFPEEQVLNLDDDTENNFAIYNASVKVIDETDSANDETNIVTTVDDTNGVYVFENIDTSISSLEVGDTFSYAYENDGLIIAKISEITIDGTTATIKSEELEMEQVFDYVKIEVEPSLSEAEIDTQDLPEGVTYNGLITNDEVNTVKADEDTVTSGNNAVNTDESTANSEEAISSVKSNGVVASGVSGSVGFSHSLSYELKNFSVADTLNQQLPESNFLSKLKISGKIEVEITPGIEFDLTKNNKYFEFKVDYSIGLKLSPSFGDESNDDTKKDAEPFVIKIGSMTFAPVAGVIVLVKPGIPIGINAEIEISVTVNGTIGFSASEDGCQNLTTKPKLEAEFKFEGKIFVGLELEANVSVFLGLANAKLKGTAGVEASAALQKSISDETIPDILFARQPSIHNCALCIDGEIVGKFNLSFSANLMKSEKMEFKVDLINVEFDISDFYCSLTHGTFAFTECPYKKYRVTVNVINSSGEPLEFAHITIKDINGELIKTSDINDYEIADEEGKVSFYLQPGEYNIEVSVSSDVTDSGVISYKDATKNLTVSEEAKSFYVEVLTYDESIDEKLNRYNETPKKLSFSRGNSACVTENGNLYMWGYGDYGTTLGGDKTPKYVMSNVSSASVGINHSACVTKDGNLYTWGHNGYYNLGDGTTTTRTEPVSILSNVRTVSLASYVGGGAAITHNNELFTWGENYSGGLGNGSFNDEHYKPEKIDLENVKMCDMSGNHGAAILENGELWMWGNNCYGQIGKGNKNEKRYLSPVRIEIEGKVKCVSLGNGHSACVTEDGELFVWGCNHSGQLGNGTPQSDYECIYEPQQIMEGTKFKQVSLGKYHSGAITEDGRLYMWGDNHFGQLGDGTKENKLEPVEITSIKEPIKEIELGEGHSGAITESGKLYVWGGGYIGNGTQAGSTKPVEITLTPQTTTVSSNSSLASNSSLSSSLTPIETLTSTANTVTAVASGSGVASTKTFYGLMPNEEYNFYAMKSKYALNPLSSENLLYISQAVTDENGKLSVNYTMTEDYENATLFAVPIKQIDLSNATVTMDNPEYNGDEQFIHPTVTLYGATLTEGKDYELCNHYYAQNVGEYSVTIRGIGEYTGELVFTYCVNGKQGDINLDGNITVIDSIMVLKYIIGSLALDEEKQELADMNKDGEITVLDAIMLQKAIIDITT